MPQGQGPSTAASPPTARVVDLVEALVGRPGTRWSLSDVVRSTGMTRATAHAVLTTLAERGWVHRDEEAKTYSVGAYLAVLGRELVAARPLEQLAHDAAEKLAAEHQITTVVVHLVTDAVVVTDVVPPPGVRSSITVGNKVPFLPPYGPGFAAWSSPAEQREWLGHARRINPALADRLADVLPVVRRRGYSLERYDEAAAAAFDVLGRLQDDAFGGAVREILGRVLVDLGRVDYLPAELRGGRHRVASIAAPVFDDRGRVVLNLAFQPRGEFTPAQLRALGDDLVRAADVVTAGVGGVRP